jgi:hypothetical protein
LPSKASAAHCFSHCFAGLKNEVFRKNSRKDGSGFSFAEKNFVKDEKIVFFTLKA